MYIREGQAKLLWAFLASLLLFTLVFVAQHNYEFIGYVVIVLLLFGVVLYSNRYVAYPNYVLWGLLAWALLHMLGGVETGSGVVYTKMLLPIVGEPYQILKYDQVIHALGFFVATLVMYYALRQHLRPAFSWKAVGIVVCMAGLGLGAFNEIVEFLMTVSLPQTNVGGYENTALDLVSNFLGAILAVFFLHWREKEAQPIATS